MRGQASSRPPWPLITPEIFFLPQAAETKPSSSLPPPQQNSIIFHNLGWWLVIAQNVKIKGRIYVLLWNKQSNSIRFHDRQIIWIISQLSREAEYFLWQNF